MTAYRCVFCVAAFSTFGHLATAQEALYTDEFRAVAAENPAAFRNVETLSSEDSSVESEEVLQQLNSWGHPVMEFREADGTIFMTLPFIYDGDEKSISEMKKEFRSTARWHANRVISRWNRAMEFELRRFVGVEVMDLKIEREEMSKDANDAVKRKKLGTAESTILVLQE